ncbi:FHA domain-containing protein [Microbacterium invictum]|uniref:FHA domain-containing protein n=1 Tax=Microbacterium invictum TaxID=515415 RepID=A0AA40VMZ6_9MICO|nr:MULTISPECIES: FHA domain-containing protein [Microbacterium]MBB4140372.1 hypothetical protein [Microbacterium invictum]
MVDVRYRPAVQAESWRAAVSGQTVAVLPPTTTAQTAEAVWRRLASGGIAALIEGLTGAFGTSLTAIPPFALATVEDDGVRVAVRGPIELIVEGTAGTEAVSGAGVATWVERLIPGTYRVTLTVDGAVDDAESLPLVEGVAPIAGLVLVAGPIPPASPVGAGGGAAAGAGMDAGAVVPGADVGIAGGPVDAGGPGADDRDADALNTAGADAADADAGEVDSAGADAGDRDAGGAPDAAGDTGSSDGPDADGGQEAAGGADAGDGSADADADAGADAVGGGGATAAAGAGAVDPGATAVPAVAPFLGSRWSADDEDDESDAGDGGAGLVSAVPAELTVDGPASEAEHAPEASQAAGETWLPAATGTVPADDDIVFGATVARPAGAPPAPIPPAAEAPASISVPPMPPLPPAPDLGDHDGATIAVSEMRRLRDAEREQFESTENVPARRPSQGRIRLSTGRVVELERPVVIGRRPKSTRVAGDELPTLIAVDSPQQDISRSHVEIRAEGEHVLVTDLDTTNGTVLLRAGNDPVRLHPGEPTLVVSGDILDMGDGVTVAFEDLP